MFSFTFDGKPFDPDNFRNAILGAAIDKVKEHLHEQISSIRHPTTAEFPVVLVSGNALDNISARVEGSAELLALIRERLSPEDLEKMTMIEVKYSSTHKAFLSYAWEDRVLARRIAEALQGNGIETWWAEWEIRAGDSLRQKIDQGLANCTDFLVLLTPRSINKPWVNQEMDAGLVRKIESQARFVAIRQDLSPSDLPPLLRGTLSPTLENFDSDIRQLVHDILGISRKPGLGALPPVADIQNTEYSAAATAIAKVFVETTQNATHLDPILSTSELCERTLLSEEDVSDALYELGDLVQEDYGSVMPTPELFVTFDRYFKAWNPATDALNLAVDMVNDASFPREPQQIAERYGWGPRRLNPAIAYLSNRKLVATLAHLGMGPWIAADLEKIDATRRFVKGRQ